MKRFLIPSGVGVRYTYSNNMCDNCRHHSIKEISLDAMSERARESALARAIPPRRVLSHCRFANRMLSTFGFVSTLPFRQRHMVLDYLLEGGKITIRMRREWRASYGALQRGVEKSGIDGVLARMDEAEGEA